MAVGKNKRLSKGKKGKGKKVYAGARAGSGAARLAAAVRARRAARRGAWPCAARL